MNYGVHNVRNYDAGDADDDGCAVNCDDDGDDCGGSDDDDYHDDGGGGGGQT